MQCIKLYDPVKSIEKDPIEKKLWRILPPHFVALKKTSETYLIFIGNKKSEILPKPCKKGFYHEEKCSKSQLTP